MDVPSPASRATGVPSCWLQRFRWTGQAWERTRAGLGPISGPSGCSLLQGRERRQNRSQREGERERPTLVPPYAPAQILLELVRQTVHLFIEQMY